MLTKPCCCEYEMRVKKVGVEVVELAGNEPYQLWLADELECRVCHRAILYGFGNGPIAHYPSFELTQALQRGARIVRDHTAGAMATDAQADWTQVLTRCERRVR